MKDLKDVIIKLLKNNDIEEVRRICDKHANDTFEISGDASHHSAKGYSFYNVFKLKNVETLEVSFYSDYKIEIDWGTNAHLEEIIVYGGSMVYETPDHQSEIFWFNKKGWDAAEEILCASLTQEMYRREEYYDEHYDD